MNKKEIVQQFTRQVLEQNPSTLTQEQVTAVLQEIQKLCNKIELSSRRYSNELKVLDYLVFDLQKKSQTLNDQLDQLTGKMSTAAALFRKTQRVSVWQRYWMIFLMGIIATLLTNLVLILNS